MPWQCCGLQILDSDPKCPECGAAKQKWTLRLRNTRVLKIGGGSIRFRLLDAAGDPVAGEPYEVLLPDETTKSGTLDAKGCARVRSKAGGACKITFPERGAEAIRSLGAAEAVEGSEEATFDAETTKTQFEFELDPGLEFEADIVGPESVEEEPAFVCFASVEGPGDVREAPAFSCAASVEGTGSVGEQPAFSCAASVEGGGSSAEQPDFTYASDVEGGGSSAEQPDFTYASDVEGGGSSAEQPGYSCSAKVAAA
jgi:hypothetical protein